ncbi:transcriptional regulator, ArsR family [Kaistia soli DSM 19436]|uniref:Transcriptional regulator, ArsR family n=1 Tax=Kaistia soli DSM 19436 TaxID=1122133 RepID=A0A1M4W227_9HYPH|nr:helix-turn-helix domain-containing protein [Kaistia soli]SHE75022.1 transcriptional regulator, ArsR family [Kaistia soli DSM 19436]
MVTANGMAEVAAAVGEPARAAMLAALMDGRALTASELAEVAAITPQTASSHLARLILVGLIVVEKQGRHRYHRLASPAVAHMIEGIMQIAGGIEVRPLVRTGPRDLAMRAARTCYDHLAGQLGVDIADALQARGAVEIDGDGARLTDTGRTWMHDMGILKPDIGKQSSRPFCRPCLDWSERRPHIAGVLGAAICTHAMEQGWVRRRAANRALEVTPKGHTALKATFGITCAR